MSKDDRAALLKKVAEVETTNKKYQEELARYRECDPVLLEAKGIYQILKVYIGVLFTVYLSSINLYRKTC